MREEVSLHSILASILGMLFDLSYDRAKMVKEIFWNIESTEQNTVFFIENTENLVHEQSGQIVELHTELLILL